MFVKKIIIPRGSTNCYLIGKQGGEGAVIDPGASPEKIIEVIEETNIDVRKIINTHGHFDHIGANKFIKDKTGAEIFIHKGGKDFLVDSTKNLSAHMSLDIISPSADVLLEEGDIIKVGEFELEVFSTPGHSPGGICLYNESEDVLFSGDTIFRTGIGRSDFPTSDQRLLYQSIEDRLINLPENTKVLPGHGQQTTIGQFRNIWKRIKS
jgi:glyoxylase-like metal-dependent hydrolase (beta-lactamase superfamily II)